MPLSPIDIHNKEFSRSFRGYNEDEVDDFLERVIQDYESLIRTNKQLEEDVVRINEKLAHFDSIEGSLSKAILIAQETAEEVKNNARKEAELIIRESEKNADRIVGESLNKARKMSLEMEDLQKQAALFRARFRSLVQSQLEVMDSGNWDHFDRELARREIAATESGL